MEKVIAEKRSTFNAKRHKLTTAAGVTVLLVCAEEGLRCAAMRRRHRDVLDGFKPLLRLSDSVWRCATVHNKRDPMMGEWKC
jgi:hypothetical protein